jgi:hypothetical protein
MVCPDSGEVPHLALGQASQFVIAAVVVCLERGAEKANAVDDDRLVLEHEHVRAEGVTAGQNPLQLAGEDAVLLAGNLWLSQCFKAENSRNWRDGGGHLARWHWSHVSVCSLS